MKISFLSTFLLSVPVTFSLMCSPVHAEFYAGASLGYSDLKLKDFDSESFIRFAAGYKATEHLALEIAIVDFGEFSDGVNRTVPEAIVSNNTIDIQGYELNMVGTLPIQERFGLYARMGAFAWQADVTGAVSNVKDHQKKVGATAAVGFKFNFPEQGALKLEYSRYYLDVDLDGAQLNENLEEIETISLSFEVDF